MLQQGVALGVRFHQLRHCLEEVDKLGYLEARSGVHGLDDKVNGQSACCMAAHFVHAGGGLLLRRRHEVAGVEVLKDGHEEGVPADMWPPVIRPSSSSRGLSPTAMGREGGKAFEGEGAPGGKDAAVDTDGGAE